MSQINRRVIVPGGWAVLPHWLTRPTKGGKSAAVQLGLSAPDVFVYVTLLAERDRQTGVACIAESQIVERTGMARSTVRLALKKLIEVGMVIVLDQGIGRRSSRYALPMNRPKAGTVEGRETTPYDAVEGRETTPHKKRVVTSASDVTSRRVTFQPGQPGKADEGEQEHGDDPEADAPPSAVSPLGHSVGWDQEEDQEDHTGRPERRARSDRAPDRRPPGEGAQGELTLDIRQTTLEVTA